MGIIYNLVNTTNENVKIMNKQTFEEKIFPSLREACRVMGWNEGNAWKVVSDKYPYNISVEGWTIEQLNE